MESYRNSSDIAVFLGISKEELDKALRGCTVIPNPDGTYNVPVRDLRDIFLLGYATD